MYELRTLKGVFSCRRLNNNKILLNYIVGRKHVEVKDVVYAEDINSMDEKFYITVL